MKTTSRLTWFDSQRRPHAVMAANPRGAFVIAARRNGRPRRGHLVVEAWTLWRGGQMRRLMASTLCGRELQHAEIHADLPDVIELCDTCALKDFPAPAVVYRMYDADGRLLYVGYTTDLVSRIRTHAAAGPFGSPWWPEVDRWTYEPFAHALDAQQAEARAILAEKPIYNVDLTDRSRNPGRRPAAKAHLLLHGVKA